MLSVLPLMCELIWDKSLNVLYACLLIDGSGVVNLLRW
jgi:hypothetical protein